MKNPGSGSEPVCIVTAVSEQAKALSEWSGARLQLDVAAMDAEQVQRDYRREAIEGDGQKVVEGTMSPMEQANQAARAFSRMSSDPRVKKFQRELSAKRAAFKLIDQRFQAKYKDLYAKSRRSPDVENAGLVLGGMGVVASDLKPIEALGLKKDLDFSIGECRNIDQGRIPRFPSGD